MMASSNLPAVGKFMPSGYDYEFVGEVPKEYNCTICFCPMWRPVLTKCGHRFCKDCLKEANKRKNPHQCPEDRQELRKQDIFEDKATERQILSLTIKCPSDGCQWIGELGDLKGHTCGQKRKKEKTDEKSLTPVPCVYQRFGCNVKTPRKDMDKHIVDNIGYHLSITSERLMLLENENHQLKASQVEVEQQYQNLKASFLKEKDERETIAKELTSLKANIQEKMKWANLDKSRQALNCQKEEFSKEIKDLRKQIKQQVHEQTKQFQTLNSQKEDLSKEIKDLRKQIKQQGNKQTKTYAKINKDLDEKIESSRLRVETSIEELRQDFDNKMKETTRQLVPQQDLEQIRDQISNHRNFEFVILLMFLFLYFPGPTIIVFFSFFVIEGVLKLQGQHRQHHHIHHWNPDI